MLYWSVVYLCVCVGVGAGKYLLAELGDHQIERKGQNTNTRFFLIKMILSPIRLSHVQWGRLLGLVGVVLLSSVERDW